MSKALTVDVLREALNGLLIVEDEVVAMVSGSVPDYQREQLRTEVVDELRGIANRIESGE
jgi:hypothetical protein